MSETDSAPGALGSPGTRSTSVGTFLLRQAGSGFALEATATGTLGAPIHTLRAVNDQLETTHIPATGSGSLMVVRVYSQ